MIPCYDEDFIVVDNTLQSLLYMDLDSLSCNIIILINHNEVADVQVVNKSKAVYDKLKAKYDSLDLPALRFNTYYQVFLTKEYGVGVARKWLMDTAFIHFYKNNQNGIIINLDADTTVANNYLIEIADFFKTNKTKEACSIAYEHPLDSSAIINYELHLRYFINMQRLLNLPFAYQTVGSAMAVRSEAYAKEGGMVKRQAGEDFYFLHKYSKKQTLGEVNTTKVFPSSRTSHRVPFGTGKAIAEALKEPLLAAMEEKRLHISIELEDLIKKPIKTGHKKKKKKVTKRAK